MATDLEGVIRHAMKVETDRIIGEEIDAATERVRERLMRNAAEIAMSVMKHYEFEKMGDRVVIRVQHMIGERG